MPIQDWNAKRLICLSLSVNDVILLLKIINSSVPADTNIERVMELYEIIENKIKEINGHV